MPAAKDTLDFIVIGAQKAATTTLFHYLKHHPEIAVPIGKEAPFFSHDQIYSRGWPAYMENLANHGGLADPALMWGTVTPQYMVGGVLNAASGGDYDERTVPVRMHEQLPDVRLVAILRDPVARARSHHRMLVRRGVERRPFDEAIAAMLTHDALEQARRRPQEATGYVVWGEYGRILAGYLECFERDQLLVVFTDELERSPAAVMSRIHAFIGVSADFQAPNLGERYLVAKPQRYFDWRNPRSWLSPSSPLSPQGMQRAVRRSRAARSIWHAVPLEGQHRLRRPYERLARAADRRNRRSGEFNEVRADAAPSEATLARLREHYTPDGARLAALLGHRPTWLADADAAP